MTVDVVNSSNGTDSFEEDANGRRFEEKAIDVHVIKPMRFNNVYLGGALPLLPTRQMGRRTLICPNAKIKVELPMVVLNRHDMFNRPTYLYHGYINPRQAIHKGDANDPGRPKWYALEPQMAINFAITAFHDYKTASAAQANSGDEPLVMNMDVYTLKHDIKNMMLFGDTRHSAWMHGGGHFTILKDGCMNEGTCNFDPDPTVDPQCPTPELLFAKHIHELEFVQKKRIDDVPMGWVRLNTAVPYPNSVFDTNNAGETYVVEIGYEVMLNAKDHSQHLDYVKTFKLNVDKRSEQFDVNISDVANIDIDARHAFDRLHLDLGRVNI